MASLGIKAAAEAGNFDIAIENLASLESKYVASAENFVSYCDEVLAMISYNDGDSAVLRSSATNALIMIVSKTKDRIILSTRAPELSKWFILSLDQKERFPGLSQSLWNLWLADRSIVEHAMREFGLMNPRVSSRLASLMELRGWVITMRGRMAFRKFTFCIVKLLTDENSDVSREAYQLLVLFFSSAKRAAKDDLYNVMQRFRLSDDLVAQISKEIDDNEVINLESKTTKGKSNPASLKESISDPRVVAEPPAPQPVPQPVPQPQPATTSIENANHAPVEQEPSNPLPGISLQFLNDPGYPMQSMIPPKTTPRTLAEGFTEIQAFTRHFSGKETEDNWKLRQQAVNMLRYMLRMASQAPSDEELYILRESFRLLQVGLGETVVSLRSTLVLETCQCVKDFVQLFHGSAHFHDLFQPLLAPFSKTATSVKKLPAHAANLTLCAIFYDAPSVSTRMFQLIEKESSNMKPHARAYAYLWLTICILRNHIGLQGRQNELAAIVTRAVGDASPQGRAQGRDLYWACSALNSDVIKKADLKIGPNTHRALQAAKGVSINDTGKVMKNSEQPTIQRKHTIPSRPNSHPTESLKRSSSPAPRKGTPIQIASAPSSASHAENAYTSSPCFNTAKSSSRSSSAIEVSGNALSCSKSSPSSSFRARTRLKTLDISESSNTVASASFNSSITLKRPNSVSPLTTPVGSKFSSPASSPCTPESIIVYEDRGADPVNISSSFNAKLSPAKSVTKSMEDLSMQDTHSDDYEEEEEIQPHELATKSHTVKGDTRTLELAEQPAKRMGNVSVDSSVSANTTASQQDLTGDSSFTSMEMDESDVALKSTTEQSITHDATAEGRIPQTIFQNDMQPLHVTLDPLERLSMSHVKGENIPLFPRSHTGCKTMICGILEGIRKFSVSAEEIAALSMLISLSSSESNETSGNTSLQVASAVWRRHYTFDMELRDSILPFINECANMKFIEKARVGLILLRCLLNSPVTHAPVFLEPVKCLQTLFLVSQTISPLSFEISDHIIPGIVELVVGNSDLSASVLIELLESKFLPNSSMFQKSLVIESLRVALMLHKSAPASSVLQEDSDRVVRILMDALADNDVNIRKDAYPVLALIHFIDSDLGDKAASRMSGGQQHLLKHYLSYQ